jgi:hypothetical protein
VEWRLDHATEVVTIEARAFFPGSNQLGASIELGGQDCSPGEQHIGVGGGLPVPIVNPIRWQLIENRAMLLLDV